MNPRLVFFTFAILVMPAKKIYAQYDEQIFSVHDHLKIKDLEGAQSILDRIHTSSDFEKIKAAVEKLEKQLEIASIELKNLPAKIHSPQKKEFLALMRAKSLELMALVNDDSFQSQVLDSDAPAYKMYIELQEKAYSQESEWWANQEEWTLYWDAIKIVNKKWLDGLEVWPYKKPETDPVSNVDISYKRLFPVTRKTRKESLTYWEIAHRIEKILDTCYFGNPTEKTTKYFRHPRGDGFIAVSKEVVIESETGRVIGQSPDFFTSFTQGHYDNAKLIIAVSRDVEDFFKNNSQSLPHDFVNGRTTPVGNLGPQPDQFFLGFDAGCKIFVLTDVHSVGQPPQKKSLPENYQDAEKYLWYLKIMQNILEIPADK